MKGNKIRNMDSSELDRQVQDSQEQLFRFRFQMGMGQTEGLKKYRALRKDRARLLTVQNEKRTAGGESATPVATAAVKKTVAKKKPAVKKAAVQKTAAKKKK